MAVNDERGFWEQVRRSLMHLVSTLAKDRPGGRLTLQIKIVERGSTALD